MRASSLLILAAVMTAGCNQVHGSGRIVSDIRAPLPFSALEVCCAWHLTLVESATASVTLTGDDNILSQMELLQAGDVLQIRYTTDADYVPSLPIVIDVGTTGLARFSGSGAVTVVSSVSQAEVLTVEASGGSSLRFSAIDTQDLRLSTSGGSAATFAGRAPRQRIEVSGAGTYEGLELVSVDATVILSGASRARLSVSGSLEVQASGASEVEYRGDASVVSELSGESTVTRLP